MMKKWRNVRKLKNIKYASFRECSPDQFTAPPGLPGDSILLARLTAVLLRCAHIKLSIKGENASPNLRIFDQSYRVLGFTIIRELPTFKLSIQRQGVTRGVSSKFNITFVNETKNCVTLTEKLHVSIFYFFPHKIIFGYSVVRNSCLFC